MLGTCKPTRSTGCARTPMLRKIVVIDILHDPVLSLKNSWYAAFIADVLVSLASILDCVFLVWNHFKD
jgi:hypothetical protein